MYIHVGLTCTCNLIVFKSSFATCTYTYANYEVTWLTFLKWFLSEADITPEEIFNMFFGGFGGNSMSGGKKTN